MGGWLLALAAGGFWVGILLAGLAGAPSPGAAVALLAAGLSGLGALVAAGWRGTGPGRPGAPVGVVVAFVLLGAGWGGLRAARVRASPLAALAGHLVSIDGTLLGDPRPGPVGWTASLRAETITPLVLTAAGSWRLDDPLWVEARGAPPALAAGDRVRLGGTLEAPEGSFGVYLRHRGYAASLAAESVLRRAPPSNPVLRAATALRAVLRSSLLRVVPEREAGLVMGLTLGDTSRLDPIVEEDFRATGLSHLTAVSGENVAMFLAPVLALAGLLGLGRRARFAIGLGAVAFFVLLTRAEPSVLRAAFMAGLAMLGIFLGRPRSPPAIAGGAVLALLAVNPTLVYAIGFQLSVAATAGMAMLASPIAARLRVLPGPVALAAGATMGAQAGVTPLLLYHFGAVPTVTVPANVLAFPAVGPGMLLGLAAAALGLAWPPLGRLVALGAAVPLRYLELLADRLARSPLPSITSPTGGLAALVLGLVLVAAGAWWIRSGRRPRRSALVAAALCLTLFVWGGAVRAGAPGGLRVTFFDVGQGDAALIRSPAGATVLIDGGPEPDLVATKLAALGVRRLDVLVATHPHADHVAGLPAVLARYPVGLILDPGCRGDSPYYAAFLRAVRAVGAPFRHPRPGERVRVGDLTLQVLGPRRCFAGSSSDPNNDSLVLRVLDGPAAVLFPGDAEQPAQADLLRDEPGLLAAAVLKVPHHGGATSLEAFFAAVHATAAVVSVGPNRYGHPVAAVLAELAADGMRVLRTDRYGDVTVEFGEGGRMLIESRHG